LRLKLDENLGKRNIELFQAAGHDFCTVLEQELTSTDDRTLINICTLEGRYYSVSAFLKFTPSYKSAIDNSNPTDANLIC
jgi:hypothetical protein